MVPETETLISHPVVKFLILVTVILALSSEFVSILDSKLLVVAVIAVIFTGVCGTALIE